MIHFDPTDPALVPLWTALGSVILKVIDIINKRRASAAEQTGVPAHYDHLTAAQRALLDTLQGQIDRLEVEIERLNDALADRDSRIADLERRLNQGE